MKATFPEVEESVRIVSSSLSLRKGSEPIKEPSVYFADESFFRVFTFPLLTGDAETALARPNSIVLTRSMVKKYFGDDSDVSSVLGKTLITTANTEYVVTGVVDEVPENSHLRFDFLTSITSLQRGTYRAELEQQRILYLPVAYPGSLWR
jgi:putative ABC transport system permease protein